MRILAFDTATPATAVAVADLTDPAVPPRGIELRDDPAPGSRPGHTRRLLELIEECLERADWGWDQLDRIAVGVGPGTFTGLRIGIATAQALARSRGLPLVGVSSLQALALPALAAQADRGVLAVLDARRNEAFAAAWAPGAAPGRDPAILDPSVLTPDALQRAGSQLGSDTVAVGDGAIKFAEELKHSGIFVPPEDSGLHRITALAHCRLAAGLPSAEPDAVQPEYLRQPDAEIARRR